MLHNSASLCPGVFFCKHVKQFEAVKSLAPRLFGVLRRSSRMARFLVFFKNDIEISQSDERVIRVLVIGTDLFQNGTENRMFRHPTRDTFELVAPICPFLYDNTHCNVHRGSQRRENCNGNPPLRY